MMKRPMDNYDLEECIVAEPLALTLHWKDGKLIELRTRWSKGVTESTTLSADAARLKEALVQYTAGKATDWPELPLDFSHMTKFQTTVLKALYDIPSGETCTYGELAALAGSPKAARAIGGAMGSNPYPMIYP